MVPVRDRRFARGNTHPDLRSRATVRFGSAVANPNLEGALLS